MAYASKDKGELQRFERLNSIFPSCVSAGKTRYCVFLFLKRAQLGVGGVQAKQKIPKPRYHGLVPIYPTNIDYY